MHYRSWHTMHYRSHNCCALYSSRSHTIQLNWTDLYLIVGYWMILNTSHTSGYLKQFTMAGVIPPNQSLIICIKNCGTSNKGHNRNNLSTKGPFSHYHCYTFWTFEERTTSLLRPKWLTPMCSLFRGSTVHG